MVGKFVNSTKGHNHMLVAVDKFTKWIEAKQIKKCDGKTQSSSSANSSTATATHIA